MWCEQMEFESRSSLVMWIDRSQHEADVTLRPGNWRTL